MDFQEFIKPEMLILVPVLYAIGSLLKASELKNKFIPIFLGAISIFLNIIYILGTNNLTEFQDILMALFTAITQGILTAGAAVYSNQLFKQAGKNE